MRNIFTEAAHRHGLGEPIIASRNRHYEKRGATLFTVKACLEWLGRLPSEGGPEEDHQIVNAVLDGRTVNIDVNGCYIRLATAEECAADGVLVSTAFLRAEQAFELFATALADDDAYDTFLEWYGNHTAVPQPEIEGGRDAA